MSIVNVAQLAAFSYWQLTVSRKSAQRTVSGNLDVNRALAARLSLDSPKLVHIWYTTKRIHGLALALRLSERDEEGLRVSQSRRVRIFNDVFPTGATGRRPFLIVSTLISCECGGNRQSAGRGISA
jgi:hypothetical protein